MSSMVKAGSSASDIMRAGATASETSTSATGAAASSETSTSPSTMGAAAARPKRPREETVKKRIFSSSSFFLYIFLSKDQFRREN